MSPILAGLLLLLGGALSGLGGAALNVWAARRTQKDDTELKAGQLELQGRRDADAMRAQAYRDAYDVRQETIADLLADVTRLKSEMAEQQQQTRAAKLAAAEARRETADALAAVEDYVEKVQGLLRGAGIPVPPFEFHRTDGKAGQ